MRPLTMHVRMHPGTCAHILHMHAHMYARPHATLVFGHLQTWRGEGGDWRGRLGELAPRDGQAHGTRTSVVLRVSRVALLTLVVRNTRLNVTKCTYWTQEPGRTGTSCCLRVVCVSLLIYIRTNTHAHTRTRGPASPITANTLPPERHARRPNPKRLSGGRGPRA